MAPLGAEQITLVAGAIAGALALVVFVVLHALWITPVWWLLTMLPLTAGIGALVAWPFRELSARGVLPAAPLDGLAVAGLLLLTLVPTAVACAIAGPVSRDAVTVGSVLPPLLLSAPAGAILGVALTGSAGAATALGCVALVLAVTLGHNMPFFPIAHPGWDKAIGLIVAAELVAGGSLGLFRALLGRFATSP